MSPCPTIRTSPPPTARFSEANTSIAKSRCATTSPRCAPSPRLPSRSGVVTQLGTQVAATIHDRTGVQWLKEGRIGKVTHAYLCSNRPGAVEAYRLKGPRPAAGQEPPASLSWNLWIGTAPMRPYAPDIYHPTKWRAWQDFGTGWSGDIGCHIFDPVWKGLGLKAPLTVWAEVQESWKDSPARRADTWPQGDHIIWTFPGNEKTGGEELMLEWFDGEYYPPERIRKLYSDDLKDYPSESSMLIGTEGSLLIPLDAPPQLLPEDKFSGIQRPKFPPRNHYHLSWTPASAARRPSHTSPRRGR